jgi:hypothetical protein
MKDGQEVKVPAELVFVFEAGDSSVGINAGFLLVGLEVNGRLLELDEITHHSAIGTRRVIAFDSSGTRYINDLSDKFDDKDRS